ncbi:hypothetical protein MLD38_015136 [Melastoma candidum]|uniref:Uncharacterized protein n=1 Tax=Melastoma candidum TaxID=119954 RepID=A0ACB9RF82_9MYRT|nr:hypothetical protein MLD38_015136 [Melastoma candidum]
MKLGGSAAGFLSSSVAAMEDDILSNLTSASGEHAASASSARKDDVGPGCNKQGTATRKKRGLPCNPDPDAEVVALSPRSLMGTNKFTCEVCNKGFRRDQNLQLHGGVTTSRGS